MNKILIVTFIILSIGCNKNENKNNCKPITLEEYENIFGFSFDDPKYIPKDKKSYLCDDNIIYWK